MNFSRARRSILFPVFSDLLYMDDLIIYPLGCVCSLDLRSAGMQSGPQYGRETIIKGTVLTCRRIIIKGTVTRDLV